MMFWLTLVIVVQQIKKCPKGCTLETLSMVIQNNKYLNQYYKSKGNYKASTKTCVQHAPANPVAYSIKTTGNVSL
jgi:hypothetical protein